MSGSNSALLKKITADFVTATKLVPLISAEVEFYLSGEPHDVEKSLKDNGIETYGLEKERGEGQYEIAIKNPAPPEVIAAQIAQIKEITGGDFRGKPFADRPGSGLHIHVSLHDKAGGNLFAKPRGEDGETELMRHAIGGLLATMGEAFVIFAPTVEDYARYTARFNPAEPEEGRYNNAPVNVSWGGNNRTTAIRIPASTAYPHNRHIEHRVASAAADPESVIAAILLGAQHGITHRIDPGEKIFGNAYDAQYSHLPPFPKTLEEARELYYKGAIIRPVLDLG